MSSFQARTETWLPTLSPRNVTFLVDTMDVSTPPDTGIDPYAPALSQYFAYCGLKADNHHIKTKYFFVIRFSLKFQSKGQLTIHRVEILTAGNHVFLPIEFHIDIVLIQ